MLAARAKGAQRGSFVAKVGSESIVVWMKAMTVDVLKGITTWGPQFGFAGVIAGVSNATLGWFGERRKWLREMKKVEWESLILDSKAAVTAAYRMPRRQIPDLRFAPIMQPGESESAAAARNTQALYQARHQEAILKVEGLQVLFDTRLLIFPQLHDSGAVSAYTDFRAWFYSQHEEETAEASKTARESGSRMMAALRQAAYQGLMVNLSFCQKFQIRVRNCWRYFSIRDQYPDHLGKAA